MEPVTHFLTGACLGRAGLNRKTRYATLAGLLAAEAADLDIFWGFAGPVEELKHHRGITHTFWAVPVVAGVVVGAIWTFDHWRNRGHRREAKAAGQSGLLTGLLDRKMKAPTERDMGQATAGSIAPAQPVHWGWLYLTAFIAALSHLLLDWTNNYGLRPFFPFNPRWYAGSFMFIAEPVLWALFFLAFFAPWVLGLADREIGVRRTAFRGRGWAIFALAGTLVLGCWRWAEHSSAQWLRLGHGQRRPIRSRSRPDDHEWHMGNASISSRRPSTAESAERCTTFGVERASRAGSEGHGSRSG